MYGPERSLWGSCFSLELWVPEVTYSQHVRIFSEELDVDDKVRAAVLGGTADRLWFT